MSLEPTGRREPGECSGAHSAQPAAGRVLPRHRDASESSTMGRCASLALVGQRHQPISQLLIRDRGRIVGQRDHRPQHRPCRAELLNGRGEAAQNKRPAARG